MNLVELYNRISNPLPLNKLVSWSMSQSREVEPIMEWGRPEPIAHVRRPVTTTISLVFENISVEEMRKLHDRWLKGLPINNVALKAGDREAVIKKGRITQIHNIHQGTMAPYDCDVTIIAEEVIVQENPLLQRIIQGTFVEQDEYARQINRQPRGGHGVARPLSWEARR